MDDFLGTSIQYSEQQLLLLEQQHADDLQKTVEELIESGFLDSDYEDCTESEESEPEPEPEPEISPEPVPQYPCVSPTEILPELTDAEIEILMDENEIEIEENISICTEDQLSLKLWNASNMNISPRTSTHPMSPITLRIINTTLCSDSDLIFSNHIPIEYLLNKILRDIKSVMILFILIIVLPHIIYDNNPSYNNNNPSYNNQCRYHINTSPYYSTSIYWFYDTSSHQNNKLLNVMLTNDHEDIEIMSGIILNAELCAQDKVIQFQPRDENMTLSDLCTGFIQIISNDELTDNDMQSYASYTEYDIAPLYGGKILSRKTSISSVEISYSGETFYELCDKYNIFEHQLGIKASYNVQHVIQHNKPHELIECIMVCINNGINKCINILCNCNGVVYEDNVYKHYLVRPFDNGSMLKISLVKNKILFQHEINSNIISKCDLKFFLYDENTSELYVQVIIGQREGNGKYFFSI